MVDGADFSDLHDLYVEILHSRFDVCARLLGLACRGIRQYLKLSLLK